MQKRSLALFPATLAILLAGCASDGGEGGPASAAAAPAAPVATAVLRDAAGVDAGTATLTALTTGLRLDVAARGLTPGQHGLHIHMTGLCEGPGFTSAGGHWNPGAAKHGLNAPGGAHRGDLPNLTVEADGTGRLSVDLAGVMLTGGAQPLLDNDGAALVVHAGPDDMVSDPAGNSGARVACGVFAAR